jgi:hypothetical protein
LAHKTLLPLRARAKVQDIYNRCNVAGRISGSQACETVEKHVVFKQGLQGVLSLPLIKLHARCNSDISFEPFSRM